MHDSMNMYYNSTTSSGKCRGYSLVGEISPLSRAFRNKCSVKTIGYSLWQRYLGNRPTSKSSSVDDMDLQHEKTDLLNIYYVILKIANKYLPYFSQLNFWLICLICPSFRCRKPWTLGDKLYSIVPKCKSYLFFPKSNFHSKNINVQYQIIVSRYHEICYLSVSIWYYRYRY